MIAGLKPDFMPGRWMPALGLLGVDVGESAVRVLELQRRRGRMACRHAGMAPLPAGLAGQGEPGAMAVLAASLRQALAASGSRCRRAVLAMPEDSLITQPLRLPAGLPEEQLEILVELEAAQYMPYAMDDASLDFCVLGPAPPLDGSGAEIEVLLVAARRASVQQRIELAAAAGLQAVAIDSAALALQAARQQGGWQAMDDGASYQLAWGLALHRFVS